SPNFGDISNTYIHLSTLMENKSNLDSALFYIHEPFRIIWPQGYEAATLENPPLEVLKNYPFLYRALAIKGSLLNISYDQDISKAELAVSCFYLSDNLIDLYWNSQEREDARLFFINNNIS